MFIHLDMYLLKPFRKIRNQQGMTGVQIGVLNYWQFIYRHLMNFSQLLTHRQSARIQRENKTVQTMIRMYCNYHHNADSDLCDECRMLLQYSEQRVARCPYGYNKPTCATCTTHCYKHDMRERIRLVMRFAGPRMIFRHPYLAVMHLIDGRREQQTNPQHV